MTQHALHPLTVASKTVLALRRTQTMADALELGEPQTHIGVKAMIKEVEEDNDGQISFREVSSPTVEAPVTCTYIRMQVHVVRSLYPYCIGNMKCHCSLFVLSVHHIKFVIL